jgi:hypothetical protein
MRYTTFRFALDPTPTQEQPLARHAGASRFAYNQCPALVTRAIVSKATDPSATVPWTGFDLINAFNAWKVSEDAGRTFVVAPDGSTARRVTGLVWRHEVSRKRRGRCRDSFRLRNKKLMTCVTAGSPRRAPARGVGRSSGRCHWRSGPSAAGAADLWLTGTGTPPRTSPPGPRPPVRPPIPRTAEEGGVRAAHHRCSTRSRIAG